MRNLGAIVLAAAIASATPAHADQAGQPPLPQPGQTLHIEGNLALPDVRTATQSSPPRVGDPDSERFEENCALQAPLSLAVIGAVDGDVIVVRHRTAARRGDMFSCADGGVLLLSRATWTALRAVEAAENRARAERERRRQAVRALIAGEDRQ
ncbi:MAG: hypothetical protein RL272_1130 [Candidatus Parcubacteria bacterium]